MFSRFPGGVLGDSPKMADALRAAQQRDVALGRRAQVMLAIG